jgi:release factor glutamine methyltransferase
VRLIVPPGVFRPLGDSRMLADHIRRTVRPGSSVLDLCCGSGVVAIAAAVGGAGRVTAVDVSRRAVLATAINARLNGASVRAVRGDLFAPLGDERFDAIVSNPPYVPAPGDELPTAGRARAWDAGRDGRAVIDRICAAAPGRLRPGGRLLLVHSSVCDPGRTAELLAERGMTVRSAGSARGPLGPLLSARAEMLEQRGLLDAETRYEDLVVLEGRAAWSEAAA